MFSFKQIDIQKLPIQKLLIVVLTLICIFSIRSCSVKEAALNDKGLEIDFYQNKAQEITQEKNKLGEQVTSQKILLVEKDKGLEKQLLANSNLKSLTNHYQVKLNSLISNVTAGYVDTKGTYELADSNGKHLSPIMTEKEAKIQLSDSTEVAVVGTKFLKEDKWYRIKGSIEKDGIKFDTLSIFNEPTINVGYKRKSGFTGYFKKKDLTLEVINPNPYTNTIGISNISFKPSPPRFFETRAFAFTAGIIGALFANHFLTK